MRNSRVQNLQLLAGISLVIALCGHAQTSVQAGASPQGQVVDGVKVVELHPRPPQSPFPLGAGGANLQSLEFRSPSQMTPEDARLADNAQVAIAERALRQGFTLGENVGPGPDQWNYEQAVCPAFPGQLILEYSRERGNGDVSLFSVIIPRGSEGHVRVIPVRRRSYSLWTPTPTNALTLNDFNHLVKEDPNGLNPDWLTIGLCYAALAGGHVRAALQAQTPQQEAYPLFMPARLTAFGTTGAEVRFIDITPYTAPKAQAMEWVMNFAHDGRLLKVRHTVAGELLERVLPPTPEQKITPAEGAIDLSKPASPNPAPAKPTQ